MQICCCTVQGAPLQAQADVEALDCHMGYTSHHPGTYHHYHHHHIHTAETLHAGSTHHMLPQALLRLTTHSMQPPRPLPRHACQLGM